MRTRLERGLPDIDKLRRVQENPTDALQTMLPCEHPGASRLLTGRGTTVRVAIRQVDRPLVVSRATRAIDSRMPTPAIVMHSPEPPKLTNGRAIPLVGALAVTTAVCAQERTSPEDLANAGLDALGEKWG